MLRTIAPPTGLPVSLSRTIPSIGREGSATWSNRAPWNVTEEGGLGCAKFGTRLDGSRARHDLFVSRPDLRSLDHDARDSLAADSPEDETAVGPGRGRGEQLGDRPARPPPQHAILERERRLAVAEGLTPGRQVVPGRPENRHDLGSCPDDRLAVGVEDAALDRDIVAGQPDRQFAGLFALEPEAWPKAPRPSRPRRGDVWSTGDLPNIVSSPGTTRKENRPSASVVAWTGAGGETSWIVVVFRDVQLRPGDRPASGSTT